MAAGARLDSEVEGRYNPLLLCCSCGSRENVKCPVALSVARDDNVEAPRYIDECGHIKVRSFRE